MPRSKPVFLGLSALLLAATACLSGPAAAEERPSFRLGYVLYVGFMPFAWARQSGVMQKWADRYDIDVEIVQVNDYVGSINQFIAGDLDAVALAGMDALTMPAAGGVDTSLFLITDYSNGNDVLLSKSAGSVTDLLDQQVYLLQFSVSHYLLNRALAEAGITEPWRVTSTNISDAEIAAAWLTQDGMQHAATWKPMASDMLETEGARVLFDSSDIPGEIMDSLVARTDTLAAHPDFAKAVTGAWYEAMSVMTGGGVAADEMRAVMASALGTDLAGLESQIDTTFFFTTPAEAEAFLDAADTAAIWDRIRIFCFEQGLMGQAAASVDDIGITVAGETLGDAGNVKLRIDPQFTAMAADGTL